MPVKKRSEVTRQCLFIRTTFQTPASGFRCFQAVTRMSLADELLADLDDAGDVEDEEDPFTSAKLELVDASVVDNGDTEMADTSTTNGVLVPESLVGPLKPTHLIHAPMINAPITAFAKLRNSEKLTNVMSQIDKFSRQEKRAKIVGPVEADPEYNCIVESNNLIVEIDNEIDIIHKYARDIYQHRFPELESLVPQPMDYLKVILALDNDILERSKNTNLLASFLTPATIMVVTVTASTTQGVQLEPAALNRAKDACVMAIELFEMRKTIMDYVESRMSFISPNVSILVGASTAAKLMGRAGGLTALSKMPSCNIQVLGAHRRNLAGFSNNASLPHTGYIYHSEFVQKLPPDLRTRAARLLANKVALAARVDSFHRSQDGTIGEQMLLEVEKKIDKWQEPPPVKQVKALPAPIDPPAKKRGGRRYRKMKERLGMTEMRRSANRIQFGQVSEDAYQSDLGFSLGSLGQRGVAGHLRVPTADSKTKARVSKALQQKLSKYGGLSTMPTTALGAATSSAVWGTTSSVRRGGTETAGTASSVTFTPAQGLEIVNPMASQKQVDEHKKYFSATAGFVKSKTNSNDSMPPPAPKAT
uniref:U4/U6 small nuclear ribonucleoprotein Prp31 n=2 Tax=Echinococcus granulosus TaxID=6210 RepID=A0A068WDY8_ECHGR|nr:U4:U6 small nuclear ribonucleoprotein Prp31 [Echinococcus granulosus]